LFLIIISVSLIVLLSLGHDYHITFNLIVLASLCFINFSLFFSSLYNADGVKIVNQIIGFIYYPTWYIGVSLGDQNFIHSIIYVFLPSLNSLILENDLLNKRFSYVVDSNTDL
jgi:lipopolysaccharide export LptBFGC system permease protein LptF